MVGPNTRHRFLMFICKWEEGESRDGVQNHTHLIRLAVLRHFIEVCEKKLECVVMDGREVVHQILQCPHLFLLVWDIRCSDEGNIQVAGDEGVREFLEELLEQAANGVDVVIASIQLGVVALVYIQTQRVDQCHLARDSDWTERKREKSLEKGECERYVCVSVYVWVYCKCV